MVSRAAPESSATGWPEGRLQTEKFLKLIWAEKPVPKKQDTQSAREFGFLITSFVESLKTDMDVQIEDGSTGKKVEDAMQRNDFDAISEIQIPAMKKVHQLSGEERSEYVFQMFWPQIFKGLPAKSLRPD